MTPKFGTILYLIVWRQFFFFVEEDGLVLDDDVDVLPVVGFVFLEKKL